MEQPVSTEKHLLCRICKCGKVHFIKEDSFENYVFVCQNCGQVFTVMWNRHRKMIEAHDVSGEVIDLERFASLKLSLGDDIIMETGNRATYFSEGRLADFVTKVNPTLSSEQIMDARNKVDMKRTLKYLAPEKVRALKSHYRDLKCFEWSAFDLYAKD